MGRLQAPCDRSESSAPSPAGGTFVHNSPRTPAFLVSGAARVLWPRLPHQVSWERDDREGAGGALPPAPRFSLVAISSANGNAHSNNWMKSGMFMASARASAVGWSPRSGLGLGGGRRKAPGAGPAASGGWGGGGHPRVTE